MSQDRRESQESGVTRTPQKRKMAPPSPSIRESQESRVTSTPQKSKMAPPSPSIRESQESRVTSTPQKSKMAPPSPSLSSIGSGTSVSTELHSIRMQETAQSLTTLSLIENNDPLETITKRNIKKSSKFWRGFKPMKNETLYASIYTNPERSQELAGPLLLKYQVNQKFVVMSILKLCTDISGFQHQDINEIYDYENCSAKKTINFLNNQNLDEMLVDSGNYLMQASKIHSIIFMQRALYNFFQKLILVAHKMNILYDDLFVVHLFEFTRCMAFSILKPIRHAGILISLKLMTGLSSIYREICSKLKTTMKQIVTNSQNIQELCHKKAKVAKYLDYFYLIFSKNCLIPDRQSYHVRAECMIELRNWMDNIPDYILNTKTCFGFIRKLILDESHIVRLNALETCEHLMNIGIPQNHLISILHPLIEPIGGRLYDINYSVAVRACEIFVKVLERFPILIEKERCKSILQLVYHKNHDLAAIAAQFIVSFIRTDSRDENDILMKITNISEAGMYKEKTAVMIESMLGCTPELCHWHRYFNLFFSKSMQLESKKSLLTIFHIAVKQFLTNVSPRNNGKVSVNNSAENRDINKNILMQFLPKTIALLAAFEEDYECQIYVFKTLCILDLTGIKSTYNVCCSEIIKNIENIIMHADNPDLIEEGVKTISHFCNNIPDFKRRASNMAKSIANSLVDDFREYIHKKGLSSSPKDMKNLYTITLRLSKYFNSFDLTELINWTDLSDYLDIEMSETAENIIVCAKCYLIWSMNNVVESIEKIEPKHELQFRELAAKCKRYLSICFDILNRNRGSSLEIVAFSSICDLAFTYQSGLEGPIKFNFAFQTLQIKLDNEEKYADKLVTYFDNHLMTSKNLTTLESQKHLIKIIELLYTEILPAKFFSNIIIIYAKYYTEHQEIFDSMIKEIQAKDAFVVTILHTLVDNYSKLLSKYEVLNNNGQEFQTLRLSANKMSTIKTNETYEIVHLGINYALREKARYDFLYLLKYFAQRLRPAEKQNILEKFQQQVPAEDIGTDAILYFSDVLKVHPVIDKSPLKQIKSTQKKRKSIQMTRKSASESSLSRTAYSVHDDSSDDLNISDSE